MKLFLISPKDSYKQKVEQLLKEHFGDYYIALADRNSPLWILAAPTDTTPAQISEKLDMRAAMDNSVSGIVLQISDYNGLDAKSLWQQLEVWQNA